ncbi:alternate-type signal peptide domain-containing protein [Nesterenkonia muleiensis]|uniref:alternate-type signal peptide domain-containing protein n=1 Tax=Nesterenkonia muleiensis TaxID=2282648 RepID=UPI000E770E72|nr:alternate-type signal peptide domain-containing protein [Nesterenkonia muleiensis]
MNKKMTGFVAGAAGVALLMSGGTYALWSDSADVDGGTITSGNLEVDFLKSSWKDVSKDRSDYPHSIDLEDFKIIPGDTIEGTFPVDVGLEGENLVADLAFVGGGEPLGELAEGLEVTYTVLDAEGEEVASGTGGSVTVTLASEDNPLAENLIQVPDTTDGQAEFSVEVSVYFDTDTPERELVQSTAALAGGSVELTQVREGVEGYE